MEISGTAKSPNLTFRYNANNEELEELFDACEGDPPTTQVEASSSVKSENVNASPKKTEKSPSILDKYFKSIRNEKSVDKLDDVKGKDVESKSSDEDRTTRTPPKDVTVSPVKEYLNRLSKKSNSDAEAKEGSNETWKIFHDFKFKITQAVEDIKTRSGEDSKEKSLPRESSVSDSEDNSVIKDLDTSVGDTDNQVSSLESSIQNLSEISQPLTAKATEQEISFCDSSRHNSESSDDTHRNLVNSYAADVTGQYLTDSNALEVESGVEALEDNVDAFKDLTGLDPQCPNDDPGTPTTPKSSPHKCANFGIPPNNNNVKPVSIIKRKGYFLNFTMYFLTILLVVTFIFLPNWNVWNGFLLGIWFFYIISNIKQYIMDTYFGEWEPYQQTYAQLDRSSHFPVYTIPSVQEHKPIQKYEGWINHYRAAEYNPYSYHINQTTTAFMKLEGINLRISYTKTKVSKRALWNEDMEKAVFYQHRLYNLTGARVILLPKGLVKRRHWSKKYPICIILQDNEKIQVLEKESVGAERRMSESLAEKKRESNESESTETNTPEKKKRFVWRRKEKSVSNSECETSNKDNKEGLRQRLVRRIHRDKKPDSVSTGTDVPDNQSATERVPPPDETFHDAEADSIHKEEDDEIDETEMSKIREFLEETELEMGETAEGEWSLHVKYLEKQSRIYIFARTGRDKHEWYRRLNNAVLEVSTPDSEEAEDLAPENMKDTIEMAVYKLSERENVVFRSQKEVCFDKSYPGLHRESIQEGVMYDTERTYAQEKDVESLFWPYILKVIQTHDITQKTTSEAAVMCDIEPSSLNRSKSKKKKKHAKTPLNTCECRMLPLEVTWVNTLVARVAYDIMRDQVMNARLHTRIQKKLHTLKLPSFMSPLVVTQLSLTGACPMVERVSPPTWDERGVWLDADLRYDGGAYITILTQINLLKLKEKNVTLEERLLAATGAGVSSMEFGAHAAFSEHGKRKIAACDSEMEDSAESSDDCESPPAPLETVDSFEKLPASEPRLSQDSSATGSSKKKFLRMVDKIATNKYFQQVTDYKYVKRAMEGLSNTDIKLQIEVHGLEGRLALNLPPPPHDRVWVGFRTNPQLILKARPAVGQRALRFAHVSNWIEEKLTKEFEKVMVLPNMEDIMIDVMTPTPIQFE